MRLVEVPAMSLEPGMFVAELDRPWLETPFSLQGFVVRDQEDVLYISNYVDTVYVDTEYNGSHVFLNFEDLSAANAEGERLQLKADFNQARANFESAAQSLDRVFDKLRDTRTADFATVKEAVNPLIQSVFKNQEAVAALLRLKESGDYCYNHGISMAMWAVILGRQIGLHRQELETLAIGCAMCDVGMTELPAELLTQAQALDPEQERIVRAHPKMGAELVSESDEVDFEILAIIENHHERMDGSGYPRGVDGSAIPLLARIAGLADSYDAMISPRPYARARTSHEAVQELLDGKGRLFQETLVEQFVQAIGLFPTGTLVELNTGEVGIVTRQNDTRRLKPEVVIVLDAQHRRCDDLQLVDLSEQGEAQCERWIALELLPGTYGVDSKDYFI